MLRYQVNVTTTQAPEHDERAVKKLHRVLELLYGSRVQIIPLRTKE